jgi:hypothetical protein
LRPLLRDRVTRSLHQRTDAGRFFGKVELRQHSAQVLKQGTNKCLFTFGRGGTQLRSDRPGHQGPQKLLLQQLGIGFVLHVFKQHQTQCHIANAVEADQGDRPRHGTNAVAARVMRTVDQSQEFVGQRHVFQNLVGDTADALFLGGRHALDAHHRLRQCGKVTFVAHPPQQKLQGAVAPASPPSAPGCRLVLADHSSSASRNSWALG